MKSKYWTMNSEVGCTMSQSLSKKISQNFNGIKYECECGETHGVIHDIVNSTDILYIKCDNCAVIYFDEEQIDKLSEDSIIKLSNVCDYRLRNSENSPNFDKMQRIMHETMHERYGIRATPEKPTINFTGDIACNLSSDDKEPKTIKLSNHINVNPDFDKLQRTTKDLINAKYGLKSIENKSDEIPDKKQDYLLRRLDFISRNSFYGAFPNTDNLYKEQKMQVSSIYGVMKNGNNDKK